MNIAGRETMQGHIGGVSAAGLHTGKRLHGGLGAVAFEPGLAAHPVSALLGDGPLGQLVAQLDFELAAVQAALAVLLGDVEFLTLFANLVSDFAGGERGRREDEAEFFDLLQFGLQGLEGVHREARSGDLEPRSRLQRRFEIVTQQAGDVVNQFHVSSSAPQR